MVRDREPKRPEAVGEFGKRLRDARAQLEEKDQASTSRSGAMGMALRITSELVVAVVVGTGIGWALDRWLGTMPLFLLVFFGLGTAAGINNVVRSARAMHKPGDTPGT